MDSAARITSKGQVTIPKDVREALGLQAGDELLFRVECSRAVVAKTPDFLELAGSVSVPAAKRGSPWDEVLRRTRGDRARRRSCCVRSRSTTRSALAATASPGLLC